MTDLHILAEDTISDTPPATRAEGINATVHMTVASRNQEALRQGVEAVGRSYGIKFHNVFALGPTFVMNVETGNYHALQQLMAAAKRHGAIDGLDFHNESVAETLEEAA